MAKFLPLPDGSFYEVADDVPLLDAQRQARAKFPKLYGMEGEKGIGAALKQGLGSIASSGATAFEALTGDATKAGQRALARSQDDALRYEEQIGLEKLKKEYEKGGIFGGAKEVVRQVPLAIAEQLPNLGASAAGAYGGAALGTAIAPGVGTVLGGAAGAFAPSFIQALGGNVERQVREQRKAGKAENVELGSALAGAVPQGALDAAGNFIPLGKGAIRTVLGKDGIEGVKTMFGPKVGSMLAGDNIAAANKLASESFKKTLAKGTATGLLAEVPTEVAQQMFERGQAGLDLFTPDALNEYMATAYQVGLLAPIGAGGRFVDKSGAKGVVAEDEAKQAKIKADEAAKAEAERMATPEYYADLKRQRDEATAAAEAARTAWQSAPKDQKKEAKKAYDAAAKAAGEANSAYEEHPLYANEREQNRINAGAAKGEYYQPGLEQELDLEQGFQGPAAQEKAPVEEAIPYAELLRAQGNIGSTVSDYEIQIAEAAKAGNLEAINTLSAKAEAARVAQEKIAKQVEEHPEHVVAGFQEQIDKKLASLAKAGEKGDFASIAKITKQIEALKAKQDEAKANVQQAAAQEESPQMEMWGAAEDLQTGRKLPTEEAQRPYTDYEKFVKGVYQEQGRQEREARNKAQADIMAQQNVQQPQTEEQMLSDLFAQEQGEQAAETRKETIAADEAKARLNKLLGINVRGEEPATDYSRRVLGRPAQPLKLGLAQERVDNSLQTYEEVMDEIAGGYHLGGKNEALAGPMTENLVQKESLIQIAEEAKNAAMDSLLAQADNSRLDKGLPRLDDEAAMQLMGELNGIFIKHTSNGGVAPQLAGRLSQTIKRYAKPDAGEIKRAAKRAQEESAAGFTLEGQTEEKLAAKTKQEEGAGKTNRSEAVSAMIDEALATKTTEGKAQPKPIQTVLEEAQRIIDTGKAPDTLIAEAETQAQRIIAGRTPQLRELHDETVVAKEGKVSDEKQQHFPQFAQRGTIRQTAEKFQKFLSSPRIEFKRNEYKRMVSELQEMHELMQKAVKAPFKKVAEEQTLQLLEEQSARIASIPVRTERILKERDAAQKVLRSAIYQVSKELKAAREDILNRRQYTKSTRKFVVNEKRSKKENRIMGEWTGERAYFTRAEEWLADAKQALTNISEMADILIGDITSAESIQKDIAERIEQVQQRPARLARSRLKALTDVKAAAVTPEERAKQAAVETAHKEAMDAREKAKREFDLAQEKAAKISPKTVRSTTEERISANDIRQLKKDRSEAIRDMKRAEKGLKEYPTDEEFLSDFDNAKERLTTINRQLADWQRKGAQVRGQPVGTTYYAKNVETFEGMSEATRADIAREERQEEKALNRLSRENKAARIAKGESATVISIRNDIEKLTQRLDEKNDKGRNVVSGGARTSMTAKRTRLNNKLETLLKEADRVLLSKAKYEKAPGNIIKPVEITPSKKVEGTNIAKIEEEARAEKAAALREDEDYMEDRAFIQGTLLRDGGAKPTKTVNAAEAQASMDKVSAKLNKAGIKFKYYPTLESIPAKLKKVLAAKKSEGAKGMILPDGTIVVIGDMHENTRDLQKTVAHEVIGHHGVEGAIGEKGINALADRVFSKEGRIFEIAKALGVSDDVAGAARAAKAMGLSEKETQALMVRELIAHTAEAKAKGEGAIETVKAWVRDVIAAIRSWFNSIGLDQVGKETTKEIQALIKDAQKRFEANEAPVYKSANGDVHFRSKTKYNDNFSPSLRQGVQDVIGSDPSFIDKVKANVLGMAGQIQWADRFAGLQHIADNVMKRSLGAMQMMYWNRTYDARNQLLGDVVRNGAPVIKEQQYKNTKEVERVIGKGDNKASIENVTKILAKAKNDFGSVDAAFELFTLYRIAKRAKRVGLEKAFGFDMTSEERTKYQALVNEAWAKGEGNAQIKEASKEYSDYNRALMNFLASSGAITKEEAHNLTKDDDYIGFYREHNGFIVDGEHAIKIGDLTTQPFLRDLVGSNKRIQDFRVSALQNTSLILDIALHNLATKDTAYTLSTIGLAKINKGNGPASPNIVRFKQNGKDMHATIDTDSVGIPTDLMMKGLKGISTSLPAALKFMGKPAQLLRKGVTRLPAYAARQLFRDSLHSVIVGGVNAKPVVSATKEFMNLMGSRGKENEIERVLSEKGFIGGQVYSGDVSDLMREMNRLSGGGRNWDSAMAWLDNMGIQADAASRVVAYRSYREQGMSDMEASLQSLETMNFTKRGISPSMNAMSIMIPFFNAQVQALYNLGRVATGKMTGEKELQLKSKFIKRGLMMAGMSMVYAAAMEDDDTYKDASPRDKYMNWFIPIPGLDEPFKLPIPFEAGYIFKAVPEMLFNLAFTDEEAGNAGKAFKDMLVQSVPGLNNLFLPQAARPLVSTVFNYDPYTQSAVESTKLQKMEVAQRAKDTTSETARTLAGIYDTVGLNNLVEMSPVKIDYLVRNYMGGAGTLALVVADAATSPFRDQNAQAAEKKLSQTPIIGGFFQNTSGAGVIGNAFDTMERIVETKQTYNDMIAKGRLTQAQEYLKENERTLLQGVQSKAGSFKQQMGKFATAKSAVQSSPSLTPAEKRERIDMIQKQMRDYARNFRDEMAQLKVGE